MSQLLYHDGPANTTLTTITLTHVTATQRGGTP